jgi:hypothetical protein
MTEQTMTTGEKIKKVVEKLGINEIIFQVQKGVGSNNFNYIGIRSEEYIDFFFHNEKIMEKAVKLLNDLKVNELVSFEIIENANEILVSPNITKYR